MWYRGLFVCLLESSRGNMARRANKILVNPATPGAGTPQEDYRFRDVLHTVDIAIETVDVQLGKKTFKDAGIRLVLGDAKAIKPGSSETYNHALSTLSMRARKTMTMPDAPRNLVHTKNHLFVTNALANPYRGRCWTYVFEVVPKNSAGMASVSTHFDRFVQTMMMEAYLHADIKVPATRLANAWTSQAIHVKRRLDMHASGMGQDGGKWTATESIRFQVRIERTVPAKAHYLLDAMIKAHDTLFTVAKFSDTRDTSTITRKRPAMVTRAGNAMKKSRLRK